MRFKKRAPTLQIEDAVFGSLTVDSDVSKDGTWYWDGEITFAPTGERIYVHVESNQNGPTEAQRQFYHEIERRYKGLLQDIEEALEENEPYSADYNYSLPETDFHFTLDGLTIGSADKEPVAWSLSYGWIPDAEWGFNVMMEGWVVGGVGVSH